MWINLSPNLNPNLSPNPSPNLMSSLLNTCLLPLFSISSRIKLVMIFLFLLVMNILFLVKNIFSLRIYSSQNILSRIYSSLLVILSRIYSSQNILFLVTNILSRIYSCQNICFLEHSFWQEYILLRIF